MSKKAIVLLADGFEDVEAITPIDYLRRAGIEVVTVSISEGLTVTSRWGDIKMIADTTLTELVKHGTNGWDAVILPGGMPCAVSLAASNETGALLKEMSANGKLICAICASPALVLSPLGIIKGKKFTCSPGMEKDTADGKWSEDRVVSDGNVITSRSAGTAGEWAVTIIRKMLNEEIAGKIAGTVLL
jgi:4-methyl-5(b-hydroxyethyl)-thiazole monophosphate biosynthesis